MANSPTEFKKSPTEFKNLLETKFKTKFNTIYNFEEDCKFIDDFVQDINKFPFLQIDWNNLFVAGGYFFKYNENAVYSRLLPELLQEFKNNQSIDFFYLAAIPSIDGNLKYTIDGISVYRQNYEIKGKKITFNWSNQPLPIEKTILHLFDSEFCKVAYNIAEKKIHFSPWFDKPDYSSGIGDNTNLLRKLKFHMKGLEYRDLELKNVLTNLSKCFDMPPVCIFF